MVENRKRKRIFVFFRPGVYLIGKEQYDDRWGGNAMKKSIFPVLSVVQALFVPENIDVIPICHFVRGKVAVHHFNQPTISFLGEI